MAVKAETGGRRGSEASTCQGMPRAAGHHQKLEEARTDSTQSLRGRLACILHTQSEIFTIQDLHIMLYDFCTFRNSVGGSVETMCNCHIKAVLSLGHFHYTIIYNIIQVL